MSIRFGGQSHLTILEVFVNGTHINNGYLVITVADPESQCHRWGRQPIIWPPPKLHENERNLTQRRMPFGSDNNSVY